MSFKLPPPLPKITVGLARHPVHFTLPRLTAPGFTDDAFSGIDNARRNSDETFYWFHDWFIYVQPERYLDHTRRSDTLHQTIVPRHMTKVSVILIGSWRNDNKIFKFRCDWNKIFRYANVTLQRPTLQRVTIHYVEFNDNRNLVWTNTCLVYHLTVLKKCFLDLW